MSDGNFNAGKKANNEGAGECGGFRPQVVEGKDFKYALAAIKACNREEDFTFRESTVKDVTDKGRQKAATSLQEALEDALQRAPPPPEKEKATALKCVSPGSGADSLSSMAMSGSEIRQEVRSLLKVLQRHHLDGASAGPKEKHDAAVVDALRQLEQLPIDVTCLKSTKIAVELNQKCWQDNQVSEEVRERSAGLVRRWRSMYRAQGHGLRDSSAASTRRARNVSMELEENVYGYSQHLTGYCEIIEGVISRFDRDPEATRGLLLGTTPASDFVTRAANRVRVTHKATKGGFKQPKQF